MYGPPILTEADYPTDRPGARPGESAFYPGEASDEARGSTAAVETRAFPVSPSGSSLRPRFGHHCCCRPARQAAIKFMPWRRLARPDIRVPGKGAHHDAAEGHGGYQHGRRQTKRPRTIEPKTERLQRVFRFNGLAVRRSGGCAPDLVTTVAAGLREHVRTELVIPRYRALVRACCYYL